MKRDSIYYQIFKRSPSLLFELINHPPNQPQRYRFESVEVKETAFRIDGVFLPPENATPRIVFFAEVQFQKDEDLYHRFFCESLLHLYRNQPHYDDWRGVIIFPSRSLEPKDATTHRALLNSNQVQRIYLDELDTTNEQSIGIRLMQLTIAPGEQMATQAKQLIQEVDRTNAGTLLKRDIIDIITTIAVYKFSNLSREEIEAMLGLNLEETRIYQDLERQAKLRIVPQLIQEGLSVERVAEILTLSVEEVRDASQNISST